MDADDLILISVDDHIAEPADMFEAHVLPAFKEYAPRVVVEESGKEQWYYGESARPQPGPQRRRRKAARHVQHRRVALRRDAPRLLQRR